MADSKRAWEEVGESFANLGRQLKSRFDTGGDSTENRAVQDALKGLADAVDHVADSVAGAVRDPEFKENTQRAARSFTSALAATFDEVSDELRNAFRRKDGEPPAGS
jgi:hypothetical protein